MTRLLPRGFAHGNQFGDTFPLFVHHNVPRWVPEVGGAIDGTNEARDLIMSVFGGMSKGERNRIKVRVHAAMSSRTLMEGRFLGVRPPYGYRLCDLGPHPNPDKAAEGRRLHGLEPGPETAPVVARIFGKYLRGYGLYAIAEGLTRDGIPSPSAHDRHRNPHRDGRSWAKSAVRAILDNPRYTGRQVWNRRAKHESLLDISDVSPGHTTKMRWNTRGKWVVSKEIVHTSLIDDETFARAQEITYVHTRVRRTAPTARETSTPCVGESFVEKAGPRDRADLYERLRLQLTYKPGAHLIIAEIAPGPGNGNDKSPRARKPVGI